MDVWIIAGGRSSRFGSNKALAPWKGKTVIKAVAEAAMSVSEHVFIIANDPDSYLNLRVPVVADIFPGLGPLSGLHSALTHSRSRRIFLLACDMPLIQPDFMTWMMAKDTWAPVLIPEGPEKIEPLHAIYHVGLLPLVEQRLREKRLSIRSFIKETPHHLIPKKKVALFCPGLMCLKSANTPEELARLELSQTASGVR